MKKLICPVLAFLSLSIISCSTTVTEQKPTVKIEAADTLPDASRTEIYTLEEGELDSLTVWVMDNIKESFSNDPERSSINVLDLVIVPVQGNKYLGKMKTEESGKNFDYELDVVYDGDIYEWEIKE